MRIINFEKKKTIPLTKEQWESHEKTKICYIFKRKFKRKHTTVKIYHKVRNHFHHICKYRGAAHGTCNLK